MTETAVISIIVLQQKQGYVTIQHRELEAFAKTLSIEDLTLPRNAVDIPHINQSMVFVKEEFIPMLRGHRIIGEIFKPKDADVWCAFLTMEVYFELCNSLQGIVTRRLDRRR